MIVQNLGEGVYGPSDINYWGLLAFQGMLPDFMNGEMTLSSISKPHKDESFFAYTKLKAVCFPAGAVLDVGWR